MKEDTNPITKTKQQKAKAVTSKKKAPTFVDKSADSKKISSLTKDKILRIVLKSYDYHQLDTAVKNIVDIASATGAIIHGPIPLPRRIHRDTVLSSPHIDKRARDQFETITYKRMIDIKYASTATVDSLVNLELAAGVDVPQINII